MTKYDPAPWTNELAPLIQPGDKRLLLNGHTATVACRVIAEENFQFAKHRINNHEALVEALQELVDEAFKNMSGGKGHLIDNAYRALKAAKES